MADQAAGAQEGDKGKGKGKGKGSRFHFDAEGAANYEAQQTAIANHLLAESTHALCTGRPRT